ncbi:MAG TPA: GAF domain-containing sensor histidine kinase [Gemmatimonadales bacterium]|nr:GAF domain-containing sensor histidine kinase [Gemmatimonadales bacterium]
MNESTNPTIGTELHAAMLLAAITLGLALLSGLLYRRYRKAYLGWWSLAWLMYLLRVGAIVSFLASHQWIWLYWHQVLTGWTGLALLWAALVFSRQVEWRWRYATLLAFPPVWSYLAIYRLDDFLLASGPAVLFLSLVTVWTGVTFFLYYRRVRATGAALLSAALLAWGLHHLDYPFLRARGAWTPWGYYLDILFLLATGAGILVLVQDELRRGLAALSALSGDLQPQHSAGDNIARLLQRPLALPAVRGSAMIVLTDEQLHYVAGAGACDAWAGLGLPAPVTAATTDALRSGSPRVVRDWPDPRPDVRRRYPYAVLLPVLRGERTTAVLVLVGDARDPFTALDEGFLRALGSQIGAALENADLYRRMAQLSAMMVEQQEADRRRLSLELHDETAQVLAAVKLQLGLLAEQLDPTRASRVARTLDLIDTGMQSIRRVTEQLRPALLDDLGLVPALRSLAETFTARTGVPATIDAPALVPPLSDRAELALFRAMQEALANVARHAAATKVSVRLANGAGRLALEVTDDGRGVPPEFDLARAEREGHLGLAGMRERLTALGGTLEIASAPAGGLTVRLTLPLDTADP